MNHLPSIRSWARPLAILSCTALAVGGALPAGATTITFDGAASGNNADIPLDYGSFIAGDATGFVTTDGTGATPNIELTWLGNRPNEWEYHTSNVWSNYKTPVHVAQIDHNRDSDFDDVTEIVFNPIDGRSVQINSFVLIGGSGQGGTAIYDWEVLGESVGGTLNIPAGANTGVVPVNFQGTPGTAYTLRFTHDPAGDDNNIGTALDDLSFGEVLAPGAEVLRLTVDRMTGAITMTNVGSSPANIKGYSISSDIGAMDTTRWKPIAGNYDMSGDDSVDANDNWTRLSVDNTGETLAEFEFGGDGGTLAPAQSIQLSLPGGGAWGKHPEEDVELEVTMVDGRTNRYSVDFINGPAGGYPVGDLNFDGEVTAADWPQYNAGRGADLSDLSIAQAYRLGDFDGDLDNDIIDFVTFKNLFEAANGQGSFARMLAAPEPASLLTLILGAVGVAIVSGRRRRGSGRQIAHGFVPALAVSAILSLVSVAEATTLTFADSPGDNADLPADYGSNISTNSAAFVTTDGTGATPDIALTWAPTAPTTGNVLEFHSGSPWSGHFDVPVLQFDLDNAAAADPTIDFTVGAGFTFQLHGLDIGNGSGMTAPAHAWVMEVIRLTDMQIVNTQTTAVLGAGDRESVSFNFTGLPSESYRLRFDDGGANTISTVIDNLSFSQLLIEPPAPKLIVNTLGGGLSIVNDSGEDFEIDAYEIRSPSGSLNLAGWQSLQDQDYEGNGAPVNGNGWEEAGGSGPNQLIESYLQGSSTLSDGMSPISLGPAFATGGQQDLEFLIHLAGTGGVLMPGDVEYVSVAVDGDYSGDGVVDAIDYAVWRESLGATGANLPADGTGDGVVNGQDFLYWRARYGGAGGAGAAGQSNPAPEPAPLLVALVALGLYCLRRSETRSPAPLPVRTLVPATSNYSRSSLVLLPLVALTSLVATSSHAARTVDRLYLFGDDPNEPAAANTALGSQSLDSVSMTGSPSDVDAQNLFVVSSPRYVAVGPSGLQRPGADPGDLAIRFDGVDDVVDADPLNRPDETAGPTPRGIGPIISGFPFNYDRITARGLQMWVYPDQAAIGSGPQTIVSDTIAAGGVTITSDGKWSQINDSKLTEGLIEATVPVVGDQWHHVMHHIHRSDDPGSPRLAGDAVNDQGFTAVVYVNGVAVSANNGTPQPGEADNGNRLFRLSIGAEETSTVTFVTPEYINHFQGVVDDLEMYVFGDNSSVTTSPPGQDYGTFNLLEDNGWITDRIAMLPNGVLLDGDINLDGNVNSGDVTSFVAGWQRKKVLSGSLNDLLVGDWETRGWGDLNLDGVVDLDDAFALDAALKANGAAGLDFSLLGATVPEPTGAALLITALLSLGWARRRG